MRGERAVLDHDSSALCEGGTAARLWVSRCTQGGREDAATRTTTEEQEIPTSRGGTGSSEAAGRRRRSGLRGRRAARRSSSTRRAFRARRSDLGRVLGHVESVACEHGHVDRLRPEMRRWPSRALFIACRPRRRGAALEMERGAVVGGALWKPTRHGARRELLLARQRPE